MAIPTSAPNYQIATPQSAWWLARPAGGGLVVYAMSGRAFVKMLQRKLIAWKASAGLRGIQEVYSQGIIGRTTSVNFDNLREDAEWGPLTNGVLWAWARSKGAGPEYLDAIQRNAQISAGQAVDSIALYAAIGATVFGSESWASFSGRVSMAPPELRESVRTPRWNTAAPASSDGDQMYTWNADTAIPPVRPLNNATATPGSTPGSTPGATPGATPGSTPGATPGGKPPGSTPGPTPAAGSTTTTNTTNTSTILGMSYGQAAVVGAAVAGAVGLALYSNQPATPAKGGKSTTSTSKKSSRTTNRPPAPKRSSASGSTKAKAKARR